MTIMPFLQRAKWVIGLTALLLFLFLLGNGTLAALWQTWMVKEPRLEVAESIALGEQERFKIAIAHVALHNSGRAPLIIDKVVSCCGCIGLEREERGAYFPLHRIEIAPGEILQAVARVPVRGRAGDSEAYYFDLYSNDPHQTVKRFEVVINKVKGGLDVIPNPLQVGQIQLGQSIRQELALFDSSLAQRKVVRVTTTSREETRATWLAANPGDTHPLAPARSVWLGTIAYEHVAKLPGVINQEIIVAYVDEVSGLESQESIPVYGEVLNILEIMPSSVRLPRRTSSGWQNEVQCKIRYNMDASCQLEIVEVPDLLEVDLLNMANQMKGQDRILRIRLKPEASDQWPLARTMLKIKLRATCQSFTSDLEIEVGVVPTGKTQ